MLSAFGGFGVCVLWFELCELYDWNADASAWRTVVVFPCGDTRELSCLPKHENPAGALLVDFKSSHTEISRPHLTEGLKIE